MKKLLILLFVFLAPIMTYGQELTLLDFGSNGNASVGNWNNIVVTERNQSGTEFDLINQFGNNTNIVLTINDSFDNVNNSGTLTPDANLIFENASSRDSFFGETYSFNGNINSTGGFLLSNLDSSKYYSFSIFSSRMGVSDNRETLYTVTGQTTLTNTLNVSNNTSSTANILNVQPQSDGTLSFQATKGANNNNAFGFFYLGAIKLIISDTPISDINQPTLLLEYPNGNEIWEENKTPSISWFNHGVDDITLSYSSNNGSSWNTITTVSSNTNEFSWTVPSTISNQCLVKIEANSIIDSSDSVFSIIDNENVTYKIIVLGSSTAAGTGPTDINNAWVWRYEDYLFQSDTRYEIENLAVGGFTTYNILPTGTAIPSGVSQTIATENNITKALTLNPNGIIINLPSNDANNEYPVVDQMSNYNLINDDAIAQNIPLWVSTPQPKNFGSNTNALSIQLDMVTQTPIEFGDFSYDFWTGFGVADGNGILDQYNTDGTHMNDLGHLNLFQRVVDKGIHTIVKQQVDDALSVESNISENDYKTIIYPTVISDKINIDIKLNSNSPVKILLFDVNGKKVSFLLEDIKQAGKHTFTFNKINNSLSMGIYFCKIITNEYTSTRKLIIN